VSKNNLKKLDLAKNLSKKKGFSKLLSKELIDNLIGILCLNIKKTNLNLKNLGTFKIINKNERLGRNPKTKKIHTIIARKSISFTASKTLTKLINK
jgi:integration host factor subunit alpha|tara:strand:+ start:51 stop:338 length:288 start_codon:yes stop_codon:yes gene_type:complete